MTRVTISKALGNVHQLSAPALIPPKLRLDAGRELTVGQQIRRDLGHAGGLLNGARAGAYGLGSLGGCLTFTSLAVGFLPSVRSRTGTVTATGCLTLTSLAVGFLRSHLISYRRRHNSTLARTERRRNGLRTFPQICGKVGGTWL